MHAAASEILQTYIPALHTTERVVEELAESLGLVVVAAQHLEWDPVEIPGIKGLLGKFGTQVQNLRDADGDKLPDECGRRLLLADLLREEIRPVACHISGCLRGRHHQKRSLPFSVSAFSFSPRNIGFLGFQLSTFFPSLFLSLTVSLLEDEQNWNTTGSRLVSEVKRENSNIPTLFNRLRESRKGASVANCIKTGVKRWVVLEKFLSWREPSLINF